MSDSAISSPLEDEAVWCRRMRPASGVISASRHATMVDFPAPEGPDRAVTMPGAMMPEVGAGAQVPRARTPTPSSTIVVADRSGQVVAPGESAD